MRNSERAKEVRARASFEVTARDVGTGTLSNFRPLYDVKCIRPGCDFKRTGWDYRRNALATGFGHAHLVHKLRSERGAQVAAVRNAVTLGAS